jgi:signal transduction histidine kinase
LYGAAHEIESAFTNLLVNGLKYTLPEGTVRMRWWTDEEGAYFSVIDSGIGIPAEHIPRLTERFYRVDAGRSRGSGRFGIGARHRQARPAAAWRLARCAERRRQRQHVHLSFPAAAHLEAHPARSGQGVRAAASAR